MKSFTGLLAFFFALLSFEGIVYAALRGSLYSEPQGQNYKSEVFDDTGYAMNTAQESEMKQRMVLAIEDSEAPKKRKKRSEVLESNLQMIQDRYRSSIVPYSNIALPADQDEATDRVKGYSRDYSIKSQEEYISTKVFRKICKDMGFSEEDQRSELQFNNCLTDAMRTKLTEETVAKKPYTTIDANIVKILQSNTKTDASIKNLTYYEDMLNSRNKLDCLKQEDYSRCVEAVIEYKQCSNKTANTSLFEHNRNKVICYVKTGIKFPRPTVSEERVRDAYFSVCIHLIEKDLKVKIMEMNTKCNEILDNAGISELTI